MVPESRGFIVAGELWQKKAGAEPSDLKCAFFEWARGRARQLALAG
jgi:hypothetical protein